MVAETVKREQQWECGGCSAPERWFLHSIRHRGSYRRLCTDCVLKNHQGLFCPVCLHVFIECAPPPHARLMCPHCPAITHRSCAPDGSASFTCPLCMNPNFSFFPPSRGSKRPKAPNDAVQDRQRNDRIDDGVMIDKDSAKALVAAARIAAASMARAAEAARIDAEKRVREAALARKRAKEALERVALLERDSNDDLVEVKPHGNSK